MRSLSTLLTASVMSVALPLSASEFAIDATHVHAAFKVSHLGISDTHGQFDKMSGTIKFDEASPESASVTIMIDPASIDTANDDRDKHLRNADFFDVGRYKEMKFVSSAFKKTDDPKVFHVTGDFTMRGKTKEMTIPVTYNGQATDPWKNERIGFSSTFTIDRTDFGMDYGGGMIGNEVTIMLSLEGIKK
jgi:polyisoprenoid-binding protein YceI